MLFRLTYLKLFPLVSRLIINALGIKLLNFTTLKHSNI